MKGMREVLFEEGRRGGGEAKKGEKTGPRKLRERKKGWH